MRENRKNNYELDQLCKNVRDYVNNRQYDESIELICEAMKNYPNAPEPHNLLGIVLEKKGDHITAMNHFRAAWDLDSTYLPARHNLQMYGTFYSYGKCAFDYDDLKDESNSKFEVIYDENNIRRVVYRRFNY